MQTLSGKAPLVYDTKHSVSVTKQLKICGIMAHHNNAKLLFIKIVSFELDYQHEMKHYS